MLHNIAKKVFEYIKSGQLSILIGHQFPLHEANLAQQIVEQRQSKGKILLVPPSPKN
jgi:NADPH:quinone reductase-like Zn-dependent oxidoreductase